MPTAVPTGEQALSGARQLLSKRPTAVELFTGVGGLSLGLEQAGFSVPVAVEIEEITGRYAQYNFPATRVLYGTDRGDVRRFGKVALRAHATGVAEEVALVAGGPPCQGFSLAGKKNGDDPLNQLVLEFARVVSELQPLAFLMENVPGITLGTSQHLTEAVRRLGTSYRVLDPTPLWACDFGVPQARQRVFLLGIRKDLGIDPCLPPPTHLRPGEGQLALDGLLTTPTVAEAISDLPEVDEHPELIDGDRVPYDREPSSQYQGVMRGREFDPADQAVRVVWDESICTNCRRTQHGTSLLRRLTKLRFGQSDKMSGIRRLDPNDVATTIRAGTTKERGSWSAPRPLHPFQDRVLTTRECARVQSFPDSFFFHPVKWHGNRQVGNAVPPLLARAIGTHILKLLGLERPTGELLILRRDEALVGGDIERAHQSGLSRRNISQKVIHPRKHKRA